MDNSEDLWRGISRLFFDVTVCDHTDIRIEAVKAGVKWSDFETAVSKKIVVFSVPLKSFEPVLNRAAPFLRSDALCPLRTGRSAEIKRFLVENLKLKVFEKSPESHDREMAHVQALTHFVARALDELHVTESELATVSYEESVKAARLVSEDSRELFQTIQQGNPFAEIKRRAFIEKLIELENRVNE